MTCPRCTSALDAWQEEGLVLDVCPSCEGVWLDGGEVRSVLAHGTLSVLAFPATGSRGGRPAAASVQTATLAIAPAAEPTGLVALPEPGILPFHPPKAAGAGALAAAASPPVHPADRERWYHDEDWHPDFAAGRDAHAAHLWRD